MRPRHLAITAVFLAPCASAAPVATEQCRSIADPAERLACYDHAADQEAGGKLRGGSQDSATKQVESSFPSPRPAPEPARAAVRATPANTAGADGDIVAVRALRHGYFALELENGAVYETTVIGAPPPVGAEVHIRHTLLGTTFFDIRGWSPITVRQSRPR